MPIGLDDNQQHNGWSEYEKLVLYRLDNMSDRITKVEAAIVALQIKSSLWGALGGGLTVAAMLGLWLLKKELGG
jgi:hypothetical protein